MGVGALRFFCIFLFFSSIPAFSQKVLPPGVGAAPPKSETPVENEPYIPLHVVVSDKSGQPVAGLQAQDFTLLDNKHPQQILHFEAVSAGMENDRSPLHIILLIDEVNTGFSSVAYERGQIDTFLRRNGGQLPYPVSLVLFTDTGTKIQNASSRDGNELATQLGQYETQLRSIRRSQGFYGATDRVQLSLKTLGEIAAYEKSQPGRKMLIWVSPGWPLLSGPRVELTGKEQQELFNSAVGFSTALRQAHITLYSVDPLGTADAGGLRTLYYQEFLKGVSKPSQVEPGNLSLQVLAAQSGGLVLNSSNDITAELVKCLQDTNAYYILSFAPARSETPDEYHSLQVKLDKPGLTARTRTGYYAQP